jgi:hypothetical protein
MSTENSVNQNDQQQQNENGKIGKKFEKNMKTLVALFNGKSLLNRTKLGDAELSTTIEELVKEEKDSLKLEFKAKAKDIIKKHQEFEKFKKQKQAEFDKLVEEKQKELNSEMDKAFGIVDKISELEKNYYNSLSQLSGEETTA